MELELHVDVFTFVDVCGIAGLNKETARKWFYADPPVFRASVQHTGVMGGKLLFTLRDVFIAYLSRCLRDSHIPVSMLSRISNLIYSVDWAEKTPVLTIVDSDIKLVSRRDAQKMLSQAKPVLVVDLIKNEKALEKEIRDQVEFEKERNVRDTSHKTAVT